MKETKRFFSDNRLNRGCKKTRNVARSNERVEFAKYKHVLPPLDVVEQYEESYPGTFEQLFSMAKKEQSHRHEMEMLSLKKRCNSANLGRFVMMFVLMVAFMGASFIFVAQGLKEALIFSAFVVVCIAVISRFSSRGGSRARNAKPEHGRSRFNGKFKHHRSNRNNSFRNSN